MAKKDRYYTVAGFVQFDPDERDYNGDTLTDVTIKNISKQTLVRVTLWPEFRIEEALGRPIRKGDFIAADGKFTTSKSEDGDKTYYNLSAFTVSVLAPVAKAERDEVVNDADDEDDEDDVPF